MHEERHLNALMVKKFSSQFQLRTEVKRTKCEQTRWVRDIFDTFKSSFCASMLRESLEKFRHPVGLSYIYLPVEAAWDQNGFSSIQPPFNILHERCLGN